MLRGREISPPSQGRGVLTVVPAQAHTLRVLLGSEINVTLGISNEGKDLGFL